MADSQVNRGLRGMQRRTWGTLVALTIVLLLGVIFYFYPRTLEVRGASLGSTFTADAQLIVRDKLDQSVVKVVPVSKVVSSVQSGYAIKYSPSWFEFPRRLSVDVCFTRASVLPATTTLPEHVYCQKPVEKMNYMCDDHNVWTQYFSTTQVADLRAYCGETKPSAASAVTPIVAGDKVDAAPVTNYYTTTGGTTTTINNEIDMPECDSDEILVWDNNQWNCRDQATVVPTVVTYPSCAPGEVLTSVGGVLGCTPIASAAYPNCAANETLTSTAGILSCTPDYTWNANSNIGAAIPVTDGGTVKFTSSNGTIVTTSAPGNILNFNVQVDTTTPGNALTINGALGLYVPAGLTSAITSINGQTGPAVTLGSTGPISTTTTANTVTYGLTACANGEVYQMVAGSWTCVSNGVVNADNGLSLSGTTVQLGGPLGSAAAATLLSDREIPTAGFTTAFSGTGHIGIGTTTPTQRVVIEGVDTGSNAIETSLFIHNTAVSPNAYSALVQQSGTHGGLLGVSQQITNAFGYLPGLVMRTTTTTDRISFAVGSVAVGAGAGPDMVIVPNAGGRGNVGIGFSTPSAVLDVAGLGAGGNAGIQWRGVTTAPALSTLNAGRMYFDSTLDKFQCSENNGAYFDCFNPNSVASVTAGDGLVNSGTATNPIIDAQVRNGLSINSDFIELGGPVGAAGAAALLSNREIPTAGFDTAFSGTGRIAVGTNTIPAIGGAGPGNVFITSNSGNGTFYSARYENPGADDTGLKVFSNTNAIVARFGFYPGFAGNYALAVADQGDMMFGTNAAGGTTRFLAAGTESMFLSPQGNLGIGDGSFVGTPLARLHLQGGTTGAAGTAGFMLNGVAAQPALSIANAGKMYFDSTLDKFRCSENNGAYSDCFNSSALTNANNGLSLSGTTAQLGGNLIQNTNVTNNGFDLGFVGSAQTNTYTSTGAAVFNGTTATAGKVATFNGDIDVTGTIDPTRILFSNLAGVNSPSYNPSANSNNYSMRFQEGGNLNFQSDTTNDILHLNNTGQVGIGISSALTRKLTVMAGPGSANNGIALLRAGGNPVIDLINNTVNGGQIDTYDSTGAPVTRLRNNGTNFVLGNGTALDRFGVGTTGPLQMFHVRQGILGSFTAQIENFGNGANSHGLLVTAGGDVNTGSNMIEFRRPDGTVIGSVNQDTAASVAFNTTSDRRLKENIIDSSEGLDTLMKLQVRDYNYIADGSNTKQQGFIAQELNDVYSQAVTVGGSNAKTNPWQVDYSKLTPLLTKSIQDLEVKKANKNEIADLNANDENFISELSGILDTTSAQKESIEQLLATLETLKLDVAALQDTVKSIVAALDQDQFGQIKIKKGDTKGTVEFAEKLSRTPVVNVTPHDFVSKGYAIKNITDRGFEIRLQEEQDDDVTFDWRAVAAREVEYNTSSTGGSTDSTPADEEESDSEEGTPVVEEEVTPTEETPVVEEEAPVTDEGGADTGETPAEEPAIPSGI